MRSVFMIASVLALGISTPVLAGEPIDCQTNYRTSSQVSDEFPGTLATSKDTPCRHTRGLSGKARGAAPGRAAGFDIVQAPKNAKVTVENATTFLFNPKKGFTGKDSMVLRLKYMNGDSALVRFTITVS